MVGRLCSLKSRLLPHGVFDVVRQLALFAAAYWGYRFVRGTVDGKVADAFQNGRHLIALERTLHAFVEPAIQGWASTKSWLIDAASWMYMNSQFSITLGVLVFIYLFHNSAFYFIRNMFMVAMVLALVGYLIFPTAPPRFFPEWGFTDTVSNYTGVPQDSVTVNALFNPFAAVPSMHVAYALMLGWPLARLVKLRAARVLWLLYPLLVTFVVVVTGNHFIMDAVAGALVAGVAAYAAGLLARARPGAWAFAPIRAGVAA
jgi:membrane-associated phospholipid phosphatase